MLLSQRQFQRVLEKERIRADRTEGEFGFVILRFTDFSDLRSRSIKLAKVLHRRLRVTDEKGHLGVGRIGVVLPCTNPAGTELVLENILSHARSAGLAIEGEWFVYPDNDQRNPDQSSEFEEDTGDTGMLQPIQTEVAQTESRASKVVPLAFFARPFPAWKRALDIVGASVGLMISSPIILIAAVAIRLTSPGPAFFRQQCAGFLGKPFIMFKLRTMVENAEALKAGLVEDNERDGPAFKMRRDPRITPVGKILRDTGMDELPQLLNVLRGEMSLVGPRPLPVCEDEQCRPWHRRRLDTKPGLTCFWQLAKSREIPFVEWMRLDLRYSRRRSLWLDLHLISRTFTAVILGRVGH